MTHNYRDRLGGFSDWVERVASSRNARDYRRKVSDPETVSVWQSLSYGVSNKCSYCMAVCPGGEAVIGAFLADRKAYAKKVVKPLQDKEETVNVVPGSDGETYAVRRFPHKTIKWVGTGLPASHCYFSGISPRGLAQHITSRSPGRRSARGLPLFATKRSR
jgi:hypothetical protein